MDKLYKLSKCAWWFQKYQTHIKKVNSKTFSHFPSVSSQSKRFYGNRGSFLSTNILYSQWALSELKLSHVLGEIFTENSKMMAFHPFKMPSPRVLFGVGPNSVLFAKVLFTSFYFRNIYFGSKSWTQYFKGTSANLYKSQVINIKFSCTVSSQRALSGRWTLEQSFRLCMEFIALSTHKECRYT